MLEKQRNQFLAPLGSSRCSPRQYSRPSAPWTPLPIPPAMPVYVQGLPTCLT